MRCFALAQQSRKQGWKVTFISDNESKLLISSIKEEGFQFVFIENSYPNTCDLETTLLTINNSLLKNKWIVIDGYHFDTDYQKSIKNNGNRLLVIDDMAHLDRYIADVILNQNIIANKLNYSCEPRTKLLLGTNYVLLRNEFLEYNIRKREIPQVAKKIIVTLGGSDSDNMTLTILDALNQINIDCLEIKVVVGTSNPHIDSLVKISKNYKHQINLLPHTLNMSDLMVWADMAISAAGSTCWELVYLGLPAILIITSANQMMNLEHLSQHGVVIKIGEITNITTNMIAERIQQLIMDDKQRNNMNHKGKLLIDGIGSERVVQFITGLD